MSPVASPNPLLRPLALILVALSLSIGWGIRGDFGHETGAWIPGALAAMAICLVSGRADWQRRVAFCGMLGGLGWGFGGSIAYMYTMSFASSGQWQSIWYGYGAVFLVGGLWAGLGAGGTALPLCMSRERLTRMFVPLCFVLGMMYLGELLEGPLARLLATKAAAHMDAVWNRQKNPLYWLDADWYPTLCALIGVCAYDLWQRRCSKFAQLVLFAAAGALIGYGVQRGLQQAGLTDRVVQTFVVPQGDLTVIDPQTHQPFAADNLLTNWPQFFFDFSDALGWGLGLVAGLAVYFVLYGRWANDAGLFLSMAVGWWLAFLLMPVLGSIALRDYGGFRLTPPRGDNWAGTLGVLVGASWYVSRNGLKPVAYATALNFILGGISFPTVHFVRAMIRIPGLPDLNGGQAPPPWEHFQSANWHSILEQSQGFGFGLVTAITFASLWRKLKPASDEPPAPTARRCWDVFSITFVVFVMTWFNVVKNVGEWTKKVPALAKMKAPLIKEINLSGEMWFNLAWWAIALVFVGLMLVHLRKRVAIVPASWLGKGQLVYCLLLWIMVIANFERGLVGFSEQRLVTEWLIIINASIATFLAIAWPQPVVPLSLQEPVDYRRLQIRTWTIGLAVAAVLMSGYALGNYSVYAKAKINGAQYRFGPDALWRTRPILKNGLHR